MNKLNEQRIFMSIFHLANRMQVEGDKLSDELTLKQWFFLYLLYQGGIENPTLKDIAQMMGVTRQSAKKMTNILEREGYLTVFKSEQDSRALCIQPTEKAKAFFKHNKQLGGKLLVRAFEGIDEQELIDTLVVLEKVQSNLSEEE